MGGIMKKLIFLLLILLISCGTEQPLDEEDTGDTKDNPGDTEIQYVVYYTSLDGGEVDGNTDDMILECISTESSNSAICESVCISEIYPEYKRYDLYMTYYLPVDECEFYLFSSDSDMDNGSYEFYKGTYDNHSCTNFSLEDEGTFNFNGNLTYLWLFDNNGYLNESIPISSPGTGMFRQLDDNHEFFLREGCRKLDDLTDTVIEDITI